MDEKTKMQIAYAWWWIWLILVTYGTFWLYLEVAGAIKNTGPLGLLSLFETLGFHANIPAEGAVQFSGEPGYGPYNPIASLLVAWREGNAAWPGHLFALVAGILFWWRVIKVVVLHGSPLPWGLTIVHGRSKRDSAIGAYTYIGDIEPETVQAGQGFLLFSAMFRNHPNSSKLMRSRLNALMVTLPLDLTMFVIESKIRFRVFSHRHRAGIVRRWANVYDLSVETMSEDEFRRVVIEKLEAIAKKRDD